MSFSFDPKDAVDTSGFLTGRTLTVGGVKTHQSEKTYGRQNTPITFVTLYLTAEDDEGEKQVYLQRYLAGWGNNVEPTPDGQGLQAPKGATRAGIQKNSPFYEFCAALVGCGYSGKMSGSLSSLVGLEFEAGSKTEQRRKKASADPDEAPRREFPFVIPVAITTEPGDNRKYKPLSTKEMAKAESDLEDRRAARQNAAETSDEFVRGSDEDEEDAPPKRGPGRPRKVVAPPDEDDEDAEEEEDTEPEADEDDEDEVSALARSSVIKALPKGEKLKMIALAKAAFAVMNGAPKQVRDKALAMIQDEDFLSNIPGVALKNGIVSRA